MCDFWLINGWVLKEILIDFFFNVFVVLRLSFGRIVLVVI